MTTIVGRRAVRAALFGGCVVALGVTSSAHASGSGGLLGLLTAPLQLFTRGSTTHDTAAPHRHVRRPPVAIHQESSREQVVPVPPEPPAAAPTNPVASTTPINAASSSAAPNTAPSAPAVPAVSAPTTPAVQAPTLQARVETTHAIPPATSAAAAQAPMPAASWPTASPSVYEELLGYVLLPGDYADRLWGHGYGDIVNIWLAPRTAETGPQAARLIESGMCSAKASELADGLISRAAAIVSPDAKQKAALDSLDAALREAIERGRGKVCSEAAVSDPLKRTADSIWIMWDTTLLLRPPLQRFYDSLADEQKAKLAGNAAASRALAQTCLAQRPEVSDRMALALPPDARARLDALKQRSADLVKFLAVSCPKEVEATPVDRLKAAGARMNALLFVTMSMAKAQ